MQAKPLVLVALLGVLLGVALVGRSDPSDALSEVSLGRLLESPLDTPGTPDDAPRPPFWKALLEHPALTRAPEGMTLRLGRVLADPTSARLAAERAGELLALEAEGPHGKLGVPLWRALLGACQDGPAMQHNEQGRTLALYGCRHSADADAGPALEDTYTARLALAQALSEHALSEAGAAPLALLGQTAPVRGGLNFEVQLLGEVQSVVVTFEGNTAPPLTAARSFRPEAPNDVRARANFLAALRTRLAAEGLGPLHVQGEESPLANGLDVRIEELEGRLDLIATGAGGKRLATHRRSSESGPGSQP